jgi:hypothetical protein
MTRWIEDADARHTCEIAMWNQTSALTESRHLHLGETILKLPALIRSGAMGQYLINVGGYAPTFARHPASPTQLSSLGRTSG